MGNLLAIIIVGIYTLVYVLVFVFQERRIQSMKTFMAFFDFDKLKGYADLREEMVANR